MARQNSETHTHTRASLTENSYQYHYCVPVNAIMPHHTIYTQNTSPHFRLVWYTCYGCSQYIIVYLFVLNCMGDLFYTKFMSNGACNGTAFKGKLTSGIMRIRSEWSAFSHPGYDDGWCRVWVGVYVLV